MASKYLTLRTTCGICGENAVSSLVFDHNHKTGKPRGWLCNKHNTMIGLANDDVTVLQQAIRYILKDGTDAFNDISNRGFDGYSSEDTNNVGYLLQGI